MMASLTPLSLTLWLRREDAEHARGMGKDGVAMHHIAEPGCPKCMMILVAVVSSLEWHDDRNAALAQVEEWVRKPKRTDSQTGGGHAQD